MVLFSGWPIWVFQFCVLYSFYLFCSVFSTFFRSYVLVFSFAWMCLCTVFGRSTFRQKCLCVHIYTLCGETQDEFVIIYYYILGLVSSCMMLVLSVYLQLPPILLKTEIITFSFLTPTSQYQRLAWPVCLDPGPPPPASHPWMAHAAATWTALWTGPTLESWTTRPGHKPWRFPAKESAVCCPFTPHLLLFVS